MHKTPICPVGAARLPHRPAGSLDAGRTRRGEDPMKSPPPPAARCGPGGGAAGRARPARAPHPPGTPGGPTCRGCGQPARTRDEAADLAVVWLLYDPGQRDRGARPLPPGMSPAGCARRARVRRLRRRAAAGSRARSPGRSAHRGRAHRLDRRASVDRRPGRRAGAALPHLPTPASSRPSRPSRSARAGPVSPTITVRVCTLDQLARRRPRRTGHEAAG